MTATAQEIIETISRRMGLYYTGTVGGGGTTISMLDSARRESDDFWKNGWVYIQGASSAPQGQERRISAWDTDLWKWTFESPFTAAPAAGTTYELRQLVSRGDITQVLGDLISESWPDYYDYKTDTSSIIEEDKMDYALPSDFNTEESVLVEVLAEHSNVKTSGQVTSSSQVGKTITDTTQSWTVNHWIEYPHEIAIYSGDGKGQRFTIVSNTATAITVSEAIATAISADDYYVIRRTDEAAWRTEVYAERIPGYIRDKYLNNATFWGSRLVIRYLARHATYTTLPTEWVVPRACFRLYANKMTTSPAANIPVYQAAAQLFLQESESVRARRPQYPALTSRMVR